MNLTAFLMGGGEVYLVCVGVCTVYVCVGGPCTNFLFKQKVVLFYLFLSHILKTCGPSKMFFSETTSLVLKTFQAFEKLY